MLSAQGTDVISWPPGYWTTLSCPQFTRLRQPMLQGKPPRPSPFQTLVALSDATVPLRSRYPLLTGMVPARHGPARRGGKRTVKRGGITIELPSNYSQRLGRSQDCHRTLRIPRRHSCAFSLWNNMLSLRYSISHKLFIIADILFSMIEWDEGEDKNEQGVAGS